MLCGEGHCGHILFESRSCLRMQQMALRSVLAVSLDTSRDLNYSHEGWVSLQAHDGHTPMSSSSDNKCWLVCYRLILHWKQTSGLWCYLPEDGRNLFHVLPSEASKPLKPAIVKAARFPREKKRSFIWRPARPSDKSAVKLRMSVEALMRKCWQGKPKVLEEKLVLV